ncbi:membrane protein [Agaricicola taiwanensis]|uniref:Membrane protein n=1 Tax=Agaricicola taiwanensis TaxID=591372 RepID=A0A8J3DVL7_9RHOB|nr:MTH938/NDUFAF3 family protein [Agaricicola taiwanensis]GGE44811.1 membrane protein [Agaricicola taiwanensis]
MAEEEQSRFLPERAAIDAYGNGGFRFGGMSHRGSLLCLPSGMHAWPVGDFGALNLAAFDKVIAEAGEIGHLLVGTGSTIRPLPPALLERLKAAGVNAEPMSTGNAARTYNILLGENRKVAAALIAVA